MTGAGDILDLALRAGPTLGAGRLISLDGPSGSGKSTLARELARLAPITVVHTDDLCPGWGGIPELPGILLALLDPLSRGETGRQPRYDWILGHLVEDVVLDPAPLVVLEGVGAGALGLATLITTLVWVDAPLAVRKKRALERDGDDFRPYWDAWSRDEDAYFDRDRVEARADLRVTTT